MMINLEQLNWNLINEVEHIIDDNYAETSHFHEPLDIDWNMYMMLDDVFKAFVMRNDNYRVVGILFFMVHAYPHIKSLLMAQQVTFYVEPKYRRHSLSIMKISEDYFKQLGVSIIVQSARYDTEFCNVLDAKGYQRADITYTKRID